MKRFFKMVKYELLRVVRNKVVLAMLLLFCAALLIVLAFMNVDNKKFPIALYRDNLKLEDITVVNIIQETLEFENVKDVKTKSEGIDLIKRGEVCFFICINAGDKPENTTASFYYDQTSVVGRSIKGSISEAKNQYAYTTIQNFLQEHGISINENYFDLVQFEPANNKKVTTKQMSFALEVGACVSIILMFGMAYSMSRDNEINVGRNLSYMPVGVNRYLMSKFVPYFVLGFVQMFLLYFIGWAAFRIHFEINILLCLLISLVFVLATISLSLIFSMVKSQIATVFLDMVVILLPIFVLVMIYVQATPIYLQILLNLFPLVPFVNLLNGMMFNGVIIWQNIIIMALQAVGYYLIAMLILKAKVNSKVKNTRIKLSKPKIISY